MDIQRVPTESNYIVIYTYLLFQDSLGSVQNMNGNRFVTVYLNTERSLSVQTWTARYREGKQRGSIERTMFQRQVGTLGNKSSS